MKTDRHLTCPRCSSKETRRTRRFGKPLGNEQWCTLCGHRWEPVTKEKNMNVAISNKINSCNNVASTYEQDPSARRNLAGCLSLDRRNIAKVLVDVSTLQLEGKHKEASSLLTDVIGYLRWGHEQ